MSAQDDGARIDALGARIAARLAEGDWRGGYRALRLLRRLAPGCWPVVLLAARSRLELELVEARGRLPESRGPGGGKAA
jgi:hypothetical protein